MKNSEIIYHFTDADLGIKSVAFSPDGRYLAGGGDDQLIYLWDLQSADPKKNCWILRPQDYSGLSGSIRAVAFSPDSQYVISGGLDGMIRIGDLNNMENIRQQMMKPLIGRDRPYEGIEIQGLQGLSPLQIANLITLGAVNRRSSLLM
ncbi:MAG: hypothetical protein AAGC93_27135 [Cyanobacteria bacterium P01_F01_bin.53]